MTTDNSGPAFPVSDLSNTQCPGMTLRDYFAAKAMQAMVSRHANGMYFVTVGNADDIALETERAYCIADAMLKARDQ